jgi:hypothetical protein
MAMRTLAVVMPRTDQHDINALEERFVDVVADIKRCIHQRAFVDGRDRWIGSVSPTATVDFQIAWSKPTDADDEGWSVPILRVDKPDESLDSKECSPFVLKTVERRVCAFESAD